MWFSSRDGGLLRGRIAILPLDSKHEFTSRAALIKGSSYWPFERTADKIYMGIFLNIYETINIGNS